MLLIKKEFLEQSILATMLEENYLIMDSQLKPEIFYGQHHRQLFMLMQQLVTEGHPVDYLTLSARFEQMETIGLSYVTELMMFADTEKFDDYARLLREIWRERQKAQILFQAAEGDWAIPQIIERLDHTQLEGNQVDTSITLDLVACITALGPRRELRRSNKRSLISDLRDSGTFDKIRTLLFYTLP